MSIHNLEVLNEDDDLEQIEWVSTFSGTRFYECHYRHKDGELIPVEVSSRMFIVDNHELIQNVVRIISIRKRLETERIQLIEDLESFAHTVAHDLKNPLATIVSWAVWLTDTWEELSADEIREYLQNLTDGGKRTINIVDELLLFAQVRRQDSVSHTPIDMEPIVNEALARLSNMIEEYDAKIINPPMKYSDWIRSMDCGNLGELY